MGAVPDRRAGRAGLVDAGRRNCVLAGLSRRTLPARCHRRRADRRRLRHPRHAANREDDMSGLPLSRRNFLQTAGAGGITMWIPKQAHAAEESVIGMSKWDLDTPALCVDLDKLERNIATMRKKLAATGIASRPHAKTHKCPAIARLQLARGSICVCTAKVSDAE